MDHKNTIFTRQLSIAEYKSCSDEIMAILRNNKVFDVEVMFGWAWGNEYKDWTPFTVSLENVLTEIDKAQKTGNGSFYENDTFLLLSDRDTEILFCHEHDIHLNYNETNKIVSDVLNAWEAEGIVHEKRTR